MSEQVEIKKLVKVDNTNYYPVSADKGTIVTDDIDVNNNLGGKFKDKIEAPTSLYEILVELFGALKTYVTLQDNVDTDRLSNTDDTVASTKLLKSLLDNFNFPVASSTKLGGIKVGDNLKMEGDKLSTSFDIDTSLSKTSSNPVENKVLANIISDAASNTNKLADIKFVIDSIKANANYYRGSFARWSDVPTNYDGYAEDSLRNRKPIANDYIVIEDAEDYGSGYDGAWRFIYVGLWDSNTKNGWIPGYRILESFTAEQQAAIDSGINVALRQKIRDTDTALSTSSTNPVENRVVTNALNRKQNTLTFDSTPTSGSSNVLTSGVIKSELDKKQNNIQYDTVPVSGSSKMMTSGSIKTALDKKQDIITSSVWGASKAVVTDANSKLRVIDSVTATNVSHLSGTTSNVQTQLNSKAPLSSPVFTGTPKCPTTSETSGTNIVNVDYLNKYCFYLDSNIKKKIIREEEQTMAKNTYYEYTIPNNGILAIYSNVIGNGTSGDAYFMDVYSTKDTTDNWIRIGKWDTDGSTGTMTYIYVLKNTKIRIIRAGDANQPSPNVGITLLYR